MLSARLAGCRESGGSYRIADWNADVLLIFSNGDPMRSIDSKRFQDGGCLEATCRRSLYLASNRAGSGRIYYHRLKKGILFCSDLRSAENGALRDQPEGTLFMLKYGAFRSL